MKRFFKRAAALALCVVMIVAMIPAFTVSAASEVDTAPKFRILTAEEMVAEMGTGWNLGNTMDGHTGGTPNELQWQSVITTQAIIDAVHDYGFNTVRIPTTWGTMINDDYSIDEKWINRVQDITDYCVNNGMYVIINIHHDGANNAYWLDLTRNDMTAVYEDFAGVWKTIATHFRDYDEHVLFAAFNEIATTGSDSATAIRDIEKINQLNQIFVDTVRATGGNNAERWLVCPGRNTNIEDTCNAAYGFKMPTDTVKNRLFAELHYYDWQFGIYESMGKTTFSQGNAEAFERSVKLLDETFLSNGIPVIIGEYGSANKNNVDERAYHHEIVNQICAKYELIVPVYWDNGEYDRSKEPADYCFTLIDRNTLELVDPEVTWAIFRGFYADGGKAISDIAKPAVIVEATDITVKEEKVTLTAGDNTQLTAEIANAGSNDALLWKSSDNTVATVLNGGYVTAVAPGTATITVSAQNGKASKDITVTVLPLAADATVKADSSVSLETGAHTYLNVTLESTKNDDYVTYRTSDESVVTVSSVGKVLAIAEGNAYITVTSASGAVAVVPVEVKAPAATDEGPSIELGINVYYNDADTNYFNNEYSDETITITGDGKYTLTFDCSKDLSDAAKNAGVTGLNNLTAVYIKDHAITLGNDYKSHLDSCNIFWNSVVVDGVELTVNQTEPKSAIKSNKQFDTNDPINSWDGSYVDEVTVENHVLNIVGVENPQVVTITFTISDLVFSADAYATDDGGAAAEKIEVSGGADVALSEIGEVASIGVIVEPADAAGKVAFVSSDASVAAVTINGVDENGVITADVTAVGNGTATITAYTANGLTAEFSFTCEKASADTNEGGSTGTTNPDNTASAGGCAGGVAVIPFAAIVIAAALVIFKKRA